MLSFVSVSILSNIKSIKKFASVTPIHQAENSPLPYNVLIARKLFTPDVWFKLPEQ